MAYQVKHGKLVKVGANSTKKEYESAPQTEDPLLRQPRGKPADAGHYGGTCFYGACLRPASATWYNRGSHKFYCRGCAEILSHANRHDDFCKNDDGTPFPLCYKVETEEEANKLHVGR